MKAFIFNGPPNSGKDYAVQLIQKHDPGALHHMFKTTLFTHTFDLFEMDSEMFMNLYNNRETKEVPSIYLTLDGVELFSPRQALIHTSENVYKPLFGQDYFGQCAANKMEEGKLHLFSDGGFVEEVVPVINKCGRGNVHIIHIKRPGCTFEGDARNYIFPTGAWIHSITNNGDEQFEQDVLSIYNKFKE